MPQGHGVNLTSIGLRGALKQAVGNANFEQACLMSCLTESHETFYIYIFSFQTSFPEGLVGTPVTFSANYTLMKNS